MRQQIALDDVAIHARFIQISASRSYPQNATSRPVENARKVADKVVAKLLLGLGACMLLSLSVGVILLLLNLNA